jgi:hypothetical protein
VPELVHAGRSGIVIDPLDVSTLAVQLTAVARDASVAGTIQGCLEVIADYMPEAAAADILGGIHGFCARTGERG